MVHFYKLHVRAGADYTKEKALEIPTVAEVTADGGPTPVRPAAHDAYKVSLS